MDDEASRQRREGKRPAEHEGNDDEAGSASKQPRTDGDAGNTRRGLGAEHLAFENAVVAGDGTVSSEDMPFVNRWHELFELFWFNAKNMFMLKNSEGEIDDFRPYKMVFCVQYYGSGKTTLGKQFFEQLKDPKVQEFFENKLKEGEHGRLRGEWDALKAGLGSAKHLFVNAAAFPNIVQLLSSKILQVRYDDAKGVEGVVADCLVNYAVKQNGPVLVHFDEVGSHDGHSIQSLQRLVAATWTQLHTMAVNGDRVPAIYFLATGKSTEPFEAVGLGGGSPCGSHFLVLDLLKPIHVGEVRQWLTGDDPKSQVPVGRQLKLNDLRDKTVGCDLDKTLTDATGGAPRLLLYLLRALEWLKCPLSSRADIDAALQAVYAKISEIADIQREFLPNDDRDDAHVHFSYLFALSLAGPLHVDKLLGAKFKVNGTQVSVARMLRFQAFFLSHPDGASDGTSLVLPGFHCRRARDVFSASGVPMLLLALPQAVLAVNDKWRVFELLVPHAIGVKVAMFRLVGQEDAKKTWAAALPKLFGGSDIAARLVCDLGSNSFKAKTMTVDKTWRKVPDKYIAKGVVFPPVKAKSEDAFHFQRLTSDDGAGVVGWQMKLYDTATPFQMAHLGKEVSKCMVSIQEVFVIACTNFGRELLKVIEDAKNKVVVLKAWSADTAAEYGVAMDGGSLLWRSKGGRSSWCVFPSKTKALTAIKGTTATVRPDLEVVLPHPTILEELVGSDLMKALRKPAASNASLIITGLDEILSKMEGSTRKVGGAAAAAEPVVAAAPETVVITVQLKGDDVHGAKKVRFSRQDPPSAIKDAIRLRLRCPKERDFELIDEEENGVPVTGNLRAGNYIVEMV